MEIAIKGFVESSLIEWEGNIVAILFLPHCNMRCPYCHATHLVKKPNELESIPLEAVVRSVEKKKIDLSFFIFFQNAPTMAKKQNRFGDNFVFEKLHRPHQSWIKNQKY